MGSDDQWCDRDGDECCRYNLTSYKIGLAPVFIAITSNLASVVGSLAILLLYVAYKDLRKKGAQSIITFLAIADLCTAISYILEDVGVLYYDEGADNVNRSCDDSTYCMDICQITTYLVFCSITASFLWTAILAFHFCLIAVFNAGQLAGRLMPLYHVIAWGSPVLIGLAFLSSNTLAYAPFVSGVWCFTDAPVNSYTVRHIGVKVALKLPEFIGYLFVLVLYVTSVAIMYKRVKMPSLRLQMVQMRLLCIPVVFIFLRVWDTVQYFYFTHVLELASFPPEGCIPEDVYRVHYSLSIMQLFEGGQGWANAILYIFLSKDMRKKLCATLRNCFCCCLRKKKSHFPQQSLLTATATVTTNSVTLPSYTFFPSPYSEVESIYKA